MDETRSGASRADDTVGRSHKDELERDYDPGRDGPRVDRLANYPRDEDPSIMGVLQGQADGARSKLHEALEEAERHADALLGPRVEKRPYDDVDRGAQAAAHGTLDALADQLREIGVLAEFLCLEIGRLDAVNGPPGAQVRRG